VSILSTHYESGEFFDEMFVPGAPVRPHYLRLADRLGTLPEADFNQRRAAVDLAFLRRGVTFTVYNDSQGTSAFFPFDLIPRIIPNSEWKRLEAGLIQRLTALNLFLDDVYHDQKILKDKIVPAGLILGAKHFRREFMNFTVPQGIYVHICAPISFATMRATISSSRTICVVLPAQLHDREPRRDAPRVSESFPELRRRPVESYGETLLKSLRHISPDRSDKPNVVLLTPGVHNSAYFEHTFLARQMGIPIVEGAISSCKARRSSCAPLPASCRST